MEGLLGLAQRVKRLDHHRIASLIAWATWGLILAGVVLWLTG
jgi:hypothetical protein